MTDDCADEIRAIVGRNDGSVSSLLKHEGAAPSPESVRRANVDQLVAPATVRADEIDAEVVDVRLDGIQGNLGVATDADPHDCLPSEGAELHDRRTGHRIQGDRAENTAAITANSAANNGGRGRA